MTSGGPRRFLRARITWAAQSHDTSGRPSLPAPVRSAAGVFPWILVVFVPAILWWSLLPATDEGLFLDWSIYRHGWDLWRSIGTPYELLAHAWNPCESYPYLYPPSSWLLMPVAAVVPPIAAWLGILPLLARPPRLRYWPIGAALLAFGLGPALYLGNVNLIVAGLLALSFLPGRAGGVAFGVVVAIKLYPLVLLPLLWGDRSRLRWFAATFGGLLASGTIFFGLAGWRDFATTLLNEGPHCGPTWNPLADLGVVRIVVAGCIALAGVALMSPTMAIVGTTWLSGVVTAHYLVTFAAALSQEPSIATTRNRLRRLLSRERPDASSRRHGAGPPAGPP